MNLLKQFWSWLTALSAEDCCDVTLVEVEEVEETIDIGEVFGRMCREAGVRARDLESTNAVSLFTEWYDGPPDETSIREAIATFKKAYPKVNAKMAGKI
tara:strand:- start:124 stop:420 length:297 start_codon:yes stop_codon:yes gene_type:complete